MLIEAVAFNLREVGEKSIADIKNECLCSFAYDLKEVLEADEGNSTWGTWNYKYFQDRFGSKIKFNSKNIVYEETLYNHEPWSVKDTCRACYGLEYVEGTENTSSYYRYPSHTVPKMAHPEVCSERVINAFVDLCDEEKSKLQLDNVRRFDEYFGKGEFPFITITLLRLGNVDHYFYRMHR